MESILEINKLVLNISIGAESLERSNLQEIEFNISIIFISLPRACSSGNINDAICYAKLVDAIKAFCLNKEFNLIEQLSFSLHQHLKKHLLYPEDKLQLQICKKPPLAEIKGDCCFTVND
jgi:FolB domain-containing protein